MNDWRDTVSMLNFLGDDVNTYD